RRGRAGARTPAARRRTPRGRGARRPARRGGATRPGRGRATTPPRAGSSAATGRSARARRGARRRGSHAHALEREQAALDLDAAVAPAADPLDRDDAVHREERRELAPRAEGAGGPRGARAPGERGELPVGDHLAARHAAEHARAFAVETALEPQRHVEEVVRHTREEARQPHRQTLERTLDQARRVSDPSLTRQLAVEDTAVVVEPDLTDAPAWCVVLHERRLHTPML